MRKSIHWLAASVAALAMNAPLFAAESPANLAEMWDNAGNPAAGGKTPADFGWQAWNGDERITSQIWEINHSGGTRFRDNAPYVEESFPHLLLHFQTTGASHFAFPLAGILPGKTYEVRVLFHRHNSEDQYLGIGVNSAPNNSGTVFYESSQATPQGAWQTARFYFTASEDADIPYFLTFYKSNGNLNLSAIGGISVCEAEPFSLADASEENPVDVSWLYLRNPDFEALVNGGTTPNEWTASNFKSQNNSDFGKSGVYYMEQWVSASGNVADASISQQLAGLEPGRYRLSANAMNRKVGQVTRGAALFAGSQESPVGDEGEYSVDFSIVGPGSVNAGFRAVGSNANWIAVDNFRLEYLGKEEAAVRSLSVTVSDYLGNPVEGAQVSLDVDGASALSDAEGKASISFSAPIGQDLTLSVRKEGYNDYSAPLTWGAEPTLAVSLSLTQAQPTEGNLLATALNGSVGSYPAGWTNFNRDGDELGVRGLATLRDANASAEGSGAPAMLMLRWDDTWDNVNFEEAYAAHNRYYAVKVSVPETGVYDFSMDCVQWSEWKGSQGNEASQMPDKSAVRVTLAADRGYNYRMTQSLVFDMNSDNRGTASDKSSVEWIPCKGKFFAKAGEYWLSFTGSHGLYPIRNLSLVKDEDSAVASLPWPDGLELDVAVDDAAGKTVGGYALSVAPGAEIEYVFVPEGDEAKVRTYGPLFGTKVLTQDGVLYAYQINDGLHSDCAMMNVEINVPELPEDFFRLGEGLEPDGEDIVLTGESGELTFAVPTYMDIYTRFTVMPLEKATPASAVSPKADSEFVKSNEGMTITDSGMLEIRPEVKQVAGDTVRLFVMKATNGVPTIGADGLDSETVEIYDLNGRRMSGALLPGVYVLRTSAGSVKIRIR